MAIIGIDFDGTVVTHDFPKIGKDIGAVPVLKKLVENGHKLILFTMRSDIDEVTSDDYNIHKQGGKYLSEAVKWFMNNNVPLFGINENPEQHAWTTSPKPYCHIFSFHFSSFHPCHSHALSNTEQDFLFRIVKHIIYFFFAFSANHSHKNLFHNDLF